MKNNDPIPFVIPEDGKDKRKRDRKPKNKEKRAKWNGYVKNSDKKKQWYREAS